MFLLSISEMLRYRRSELPHERNPRGYLRKPLGGTVISTKVDPSRTLLAYNAKGCASLCQVLRQVSEVQQFHQTTILRTDPYDGTLVVCLIGARYHGTIPDSDKATKVFGTWHRLFHQVGRSEGLSNYHGEEHPKFCLEKYHMQVRDTQSAGL